MTPSIPSFLAVNRQSSFLHSLHVELLTRYGEGRHDPAVGVQDVARDAVVDTGDGVADEVIAGDEETADEEDGSGGPVVELEEGSLDLCLGAPVPGLDEAGHGHEEPHDGHGDSVLLLSVMVMIHWERN